MNHERRWVFDTNVIISAAMFECSVSGQAFYTALGAGKMLLSAETFAELAEVLGRTKFDRYVSREKRDQFLAQVVRDSFLVEPSAEVQVCRDPSDDKFLELSIDGQATCLVSGDRDLLALHPFRGIPILTPSQFLMFVSESEPPAAQTDSESKSQQPPS